MSTNVIFLQEFSKKTKTRIEGFKKIAENFRRMIPYEKNREATLT